MDEIDRKLISKLQQDGRTNFIELSKIIGYTNVGTKKRVNKLVDRKVLKFSTLLNITKLGMSAAIILMEIENSEALEKFLERFKECPRVVYIFTTMGAYNLIALVVAEDQETLESISVEKCSLRSGEGIRRSEFIPVGRIMYSPFMPLEKFLPSKKKAKAPCNVDCRSCKKYRAECGGCPAANYYLGKQKK